ncbi:MAG: carboxypeptidase regulatory-like domain-containing protein [Patescibacteria group bacterium]|nr:carboxypeptidase regulatory-like domain-containing protein [Patescibacteria group bacterium]
MANDDSFEAQKTHQQHPIPQNVMGVEFKLVGGLTLRQFGLLAVFIILAWIIYSSGMPSFIKTPVAAVVAIFGAFLSLVPIQDRSADVWLKNFLMAVSSPTERVWRKGAANLDVFFELREAHTAIRQEKQNYLPRDKSQLNEYLRQTADANLTPEDLAEKEFLKSVSFLQSEVSVPSSLAPKTSAAPTTTVKPAEGEAVSDRESFKPRAEVKLGKNLASEINFSQEKVISLPSLSGGAPKFVTPIQNVRSGRRLRLVKPGEVGIAIKGERSLSRPEDAPPAKTSELAENLTQRIVDVDQKISEAQKTTPRSTVIESKHDDSTLSKQSNITGAPAEAGTQSKPVEPSESPETISQREEAARIGYLKDELEKMRRDRENLAKELLEQKKAREEAETLAAMAEEYQRRASEMSAQNTRLSNEIRQAQAELSKLKEVTTNTQSDRENLIKQIRDNEHRVEELAREKTQATDSLINLQKEMRELRLKQRFTPPPPPAGGPAPSPAAKSIGRLPPFVKDRANVISGYVRAKNGDLIKNAVIIVKDADGSPVRALKTNALGQFAITTVVPNGHYTVEASAPGETFAIMNVDAFGEVLEPLDFVGI